MKSSAGLEFMRLLEPFGATVTEAPNFGFGATPDAQDFWCMTLYTPDGVHVSYQLAKSNGDGRFFPMPVCEAALPNVEEARAYMAEVVRNIDIDGLRLCGFSHL